MVARAKEAVPFREAGFPRSSSVITFSRWYQYAYTLYDKSNLSTRDDVSNFYRKSLQIGPTTAPGEELACASFPRLSDLLSSRPPAIERGGRSRKMTIYRLHCHSMVGCEESPVTAVGAAGLPGGSFVSATRICVFGIRYRSPFNSPTRLHKSLPRNCIPNLLVFICIVTRTEFSLYLPSIYPHACGTQEFWTSLLHF